MGKTQLAGTPDNFCPTHNRSFGYATEINLAGALHQNIASEHDKAGNSKSSLAILPKTPAGPVET